MQQKGASPKQSCLSTEQNSITAIGMCGEQPRSQGSGGCRVIPVVWGGAMGGGSSLPVQVVGGSQGGLEVVMVDCIGSLWAPLVLASVWIDSWVISSLGSG